MHPNAGQRNFMTKAASAAPGSAIPRALLEKTSDDEPAGEVKRPARLTAVGLTGAVEEREFEKSPATPSATQGPGEDAKSPAPADKISAVFGGGPPTKAEHILRKWLGVPTEANEGADATSTEGGDKNAKDSSLSKPKVNKTIRKWQKRAMYGKAERASGLNIDEEYKAWYIDQRDRFRVQLPEALQAAVAEEALEILKPMCARYEKLLGPDDELVRLAEQRRAEVERQLSGMGKQRKLLRTASRGISLRSLGMSNNSLNIGKDSAANS